MVVNSDWHNLPTLIKHELAATVAGVVNPPKNGDEPRAGKRHTAHHSHPSKAVTAYRIKRILLIVQEKSSLGKRRVRRVSISYARFPRNPRNTRVPNLADSNTPVELKRKPPRCLND